MTSHSVRPAAPIFAALQAQVERDRSSSSSREGMTTADSEMVAEGQTLSRSHAPTSLKFVPRQDRYSRFKVTILKQSVIGTSTIFKIVIRPEPHWRGRKAGTPARRRRARPPQRMAAPPGAIMGNWVSGGERGTLLVNPLDLPPAA